MMCRDYVTDLILSKQKDMLSYHTMYIYILRSPTNSLCTSKYSKLQASKFLSTLIYFEIYFIYYLLHVCKSIMTFTQINIYKRKLIMLIARSNWKLAIVLIGANIDNCLTLVKLRFKVIDCPMYPFNMPLRWLRL